MIVQKELFGEGKHVEFKAEIPKKHEKFLKDIIAFANSSGGKTIVGIEDETGEVSGLGDQNPFKLSDAISSMISDACTPQIYTEITAKTIEGKTILEVEVFPGVNRPYYLKSAGKERSAYIRINGTSRPASEFRLKELEMEGMHISHDSLWEIGRQYDEAATNELMHSMYQTALSNCKSAEERESVHELTVEKLEDFGILRKEEGKIVPTRAFTLLTRPKERYIKIQCALFKGITRVDFIDRKEFRGAIQDQIEEAHQFVLRHTNKGAIIEGLYRQDVYELPVNAIREIIVNAVLHRSYVDEASIQVSIFDDRIEIDSPGMLFAGLSITDALSGKSKCRNKVIAEAFQYMKIIEGWGTGLPRLFERCKEMGLPEPKFEEFGDGIKVTVYRALDASRNTIIDTGNETGDTVNAISTDIETDSKTNTKTGDDKKTDTKIMNTSTEITGKGESDVKLTDTEKALCAIMKKTPSITIVALADATKLSVSGVRYALSRLRSKGIVERVGAQKNGQWIVRFPGEN